MTKKLWSGRFKKGLSPLVERFTESLSFDHRLMPYDIAGSIAHVKMLAYTKIVPAKEAKKIIKALEELKTMTPPFGGEEDIHMFIENTLIKKIGDTAKHMHTGRSRNDQVQVDTRLYTKDEIKNIIQRIISLQESFISLADQNKEVILPGFTHLQHAQPVLLAHHLLAYVNMLQRDIDRFNDLFVRVDILPLGSGAIAGSNLPLDRAYTAKLLGFSKVSANSIDAISDRDYLAELLSCIAITGMHLSRFAEEIVLWCTKEFSFIDLDDSLCTGSSLMPQKKNPDPAELLRGKTGRIYGNLINLLTSLKGLPLTYNRDLQEDKPPVFDSVDTIKISLEVAKGLTEGMTVNKQHIALTLEQDDSFLATDLADYLVMKDVPFRQAHHDVGRLVQYCQGKGLRFIDLDIDTFKIFNDRFGSDIKSKLDAKTSVKEKKTIGSTNPDMVHKEIGKWKKILN